MNKTLRTSGLYVSAVGLGIQHFDKNSRFAVLAITILGRLKFCLGALAYKIPLVATGMELCSGTNMFLGIVRNG